MSGTRSTYDAMQPPTYDVMPFWSTGARDAGAACRNRTDDLFMTSVGGGWFR